MNGFAGVLLFDGKLDAAVLCRQIIAKQSHLGGGNIHVRSSSGLAIGQQAIRASKNEPRPIMNEAGNLVLALAGRLDNRHALHRKLQPPSDLQGMPDGALLLEAYRKWGEACVEYLEGDFAFALWDDNRNHLFCARDAMGGAPFAYVMNPQFMALASHAEALLGLPGVEARPNEDRIAGLLIKDFLHCDERTTWQKGVRALLAGESLSVDRRGRCRAGGQIKLKPLENVNYSSDEQCEGHFLEVFGRAVENRVRPGENCALLLSGGLDSAAVASVLERRSREIGSSICRSYSAIEDDVTSSAESRAIDSITGTLGFDANLLSLPSFSGIATEEDLVDAAWSSTHPVDNSLLMLRVLMRAASGRGEQVLLLGASGDSTLSTPKRYVAQYMAQGRVLQAWRECQAAASHHVYLQRESAMTNFFTSAGHAFAPEVLKEGVRRLRRVQSDFGLKDTFINPDFAARLRLQERLHQSHAELEHSRVDDLERSLAERRQLDIMSAMSGAVQAAAGYGLEARDPFADRRVVEFFLGLPQRFKVRDGWTKYLVRHALRNDLPPEVVWRSDKGHLGWQCVKRLMEISKPLTDHLVHEELDVIADYVDVQAVRNLYIRHTQEWAPDTDYALFELLTLILWIKRVHSQPVDYSSYLRFGDGPVGRITH